MTDPAYVLISPCRDEIEYAGRTLDSVLAQSILPALWVIVDDGSTDGTLELLRGFEAEYSFIRVIERRDRGIRKVGGGVIEAFNDGLAVIDLDDYEYLCKLDLDLVLPPEYFEGLITRMRGDERLGTVSGKAWYREANDELRPEAIGDDVSLGMTKFYRVSCFRQIGGFVAEVMWDGIDCHQCRRLGWRVRSEDCEQLRFIHLRPMGSSHKSLLTGRARHGRGQYFMGTGLLFMMASATFRLFKSPMILGSLAMMKGYLGAAIRREKRFADPGFRRYLHRYHRHCLLFGKSNAVRKLEADGETSWNPDR